MAETDHMEEEDPYHFYVFYTKDGIASYWIIYEDVEEEGVYAATLRIEDMLIDIQITPLMGGFRLEKTFLTKDEEEINSYVADYKGICFTDKEGFKYEFMR